MGSYHTAAFVKYVFCRLAWWWIRDWWFMAACILNDTANNTRIKKIHRFVVFCVTETRINQWRNLFKLNWLYEWLYPRLKYWLWIDSFETNWVYLFIDTENLAFDFVTTFFINKMRSSCTWYPLARNPCISGHFPIAAIFACTFLFENLFYLF
jgi:hypothetical protein